MHTTRGTREEQTELRRQQIIEAAEYLFARKGIHAVSLNEINKAAGQKNNNALHYHFDNRKGLIEAIIDQHHHQLMAQLDEPLEKCEKLVDSPGDDPSLTQVLSAYVAPYVSLLDNKRGQYYVQIVTQLLYTDTDLALEPRRINQRGRLEALIATKIPRTSTELDNMRTISFVHVLLSTLSLYSQMTSDKTEKVYGNRTQFKKNLVTILEGVLTAA